MKKYFSLMVFSCLVITAIMVQARQGKGPVFSDFSDNGNETVLDSKTGLTWAKCAIGQKGTSCTGVPKKFSFHDAVTACGELELAGKNDWRLPTGFELSYLVDCQGYPYGPMSEGFDCGRMNEIKYPLVNSRYFPGTRKFYYWALKEPDCYYPADKCVAVIDFGDADNGKLRTDTDPDEKYYVRCVRGEVYSIW